MGIDCRQLKEIVIVPTLTALGYYSDSAVGLLLGTAAQESQMGQFIAQKDIGLRGGIGIFQMQKEAYDKLWENVIWPNVALRAKIRLLLGFNSKPDAVRMASDLQLSVLMARLYYYVIKRPLPEKGDIAGYAAFYKEFWNTKEGKATEQEFIENYKRYVTC